MRSCVSLRSLRSPLVGGFTQNSIEDMLNLKHHTVFHRKHQTELHRENTEFKEQLTFSFCD